MIRLYSTGTLTDVNTNSTSPSEPQTFTLTLSHARYVHLLDSPMAHFLPSHLCLFKYHPSRGTLTILHKITPPPPFLSIPLLVSFSPSLHVSPTYILCIYLFIAYFSPLECNESSIGKRIMLYCVASFKPKTGLGV